MTDNARIRTIAPGVTAEMIAEQTHLFYDPATGGGYVSFQAREHLVVGDDVQAPMGDFDILQAQIPDILAIKFGTGLVDPVTGQAMDNITPAGISVYIKATYDKLFAARAAAESASNPPAP